ncbi:MAG TPA: hypothetical protein VIM29_13985 [Bacillota bacterium]
MDEQIITLINWKQLQKAEASRKIEIFESIEKGYLKTGDITLNFVERTIFDGRLNVKLPDNFKIISNETAQLPYPLDSIPDLIYSEPKASVSITFTHSLVPLHDAEVENYKAELMLAVAQKQPEVRWEETGIKKVAGRNIGFCDFIIPDPDEDIYNFMFVMELHHRVLTGGVFCPAIKMNTWKPLALGMMNAVKVNDGIIEPEVQSEARDFTNYDFKCGLYATYQDREYRVYKLRDGCYRLVSNDPDDLANGFEKKDGIYKKTVTAGELQAVYEFKTRVVFQGHQFELGQVRENRLQLLVDSGERALINQFQFEIGFGKYEKWVAKELIEDVIVETVRSNP